MAGPAGRDNGDNVCLAGGGKVTDLWKKASIIPLRKAGKDDYTSAESYRPISLLQTISKVLESVVVEHVSYLVSFSPILFLFLMLTC